MAPHGSSMTRSSSSDSSALSNIMVAGARDDDSASEHAPASTPPTSLNDSGSLGSAKATVDPMGVIEEESGRRPKRAKSSVSTYNIKKLSEATETVSAGSSRNVSGLTGKTLVQGEEDTTPFGSKVEKALDMDWELSGGSLRKKIPATVQRRSSVKDRVKKVVGKVGSVLGKRRREVIEAGKRTFGRAEEEHLSPKQSKVLKELDTGPKGVLDEMDLSDDEFDMPAPRPAKRTKTSNKSIVPEAQQPILPTAAPLKISSGNRVKKWQKEGLYVGQDPDMKPTQDGGKKLQKKRPESSSSDATAMTGDTATKKSFMTLPMFSYLDKSRDFTIPFDIFAPSSKKAEKPKEWTKINRNRIVGEARELWEKSEKLPTSMCVCQPPAPGQQGCEDDCLNRVMQYECNDDNCCLPADECSNRAFAELAARVKKAGQFDIGVEVIKTTDRGFGVRSCRTFAPGQIIMEYTGEIISEGECQRRMREEYKDKQCYYLMELERGLIIDGTKGSMARFINHSCAPNCEVRMVKVNGTPRMAVFAGDHGIMTGEELTYDYNFDNFGTTKQACYCGAPTCRGYLSKRLNAAEQKKQAREEMERKRQASEAAQKQAEKEAKKKQVRDDRGASWRGWVAVDDPETKERLKAEKREKEEAEKNSSRAKRLAARRTSMPAPSSTETDLAARQTGLKRRKTVYVQEESAEEDNVKVAGASASNAPVTKTTSRRTHMRTTSTGSKFTEELARPSSAQTSSTIIKQTEVSVSTTEVISVEEHTSAGADLEESKPSLSDNHGLVRTASRGKEIMKSVGQAVKNGFIGLDKGKAGPGNGKLRQSTLSFGKLN